MDVKTEELISSARAATTYIHTVRTLEKPAASFVENHGNDGANVFDFIQSEVRSETKSRSTYSQSVKTSPSSSSLGMGSTYSSARVVVVVVFSRAAFFLRTRISNSRRHITTC